MIQFARLRNKNIIGYAEDDFAESVTIFLSSGGCCVLTKNTVIETLDNYEVSDLEALFNIILKNPEGDTTFGANPLFYTAENSPSGVSLAYTMKEDSITKKKSRF